MQLITPKAYYNEYDPYAAQWLRNLIAGGHIAPGEVDERSIVDVRPDDLAGFRQCHFFAGIGVWSYAIRRAGVPDDTPLWTGSCPCQPFSAAGKGDGVADERHLWPAWQNLIGQRRPPVVFGEQVASKDGLGWLDLVQADMEGADYAFAAADLCAAGVGAPHIRQRLWFVGEDTLGDTPHNGYLRRELGNQAGTQRPALVGRQDEGRGRNDAADDGGTNGLADSDGARGAPRLSAPGHGQEGYAGEPDDGRRQQRGAAGTPASEYPGPTNGFWRDADWLYCRDGKWRPVEPGTFPLAHGAASRVGRLRAYGNAIVAQAAETFIRSYLEARG